MTVLESDAGRRSRAATPGPAGWLGLAAAPTFAIMALLTYASSGRADMMCSPAQDASPPTGMVLMYLLMCAFHSSPWLKLGRNAAAPRA